MKWWVLIKLFCKCMTELFQTQSQVGISLRTGFRVTPGSGQAEQLHPVGHWRRPLHSHRKDRPVRQGLSRLQGFSRRRNFRSNADFSRFKLTWNKSNQTFKSLLSATIPSWQLTNCIAANFWVISRNAQSVATCSIGSIILLVAVLFLKEMYLYCILPSFISSEYQHL